MRASSTDDAPTERRYKRWIVGAPPGDQQALLTRPIVLTTASLMPQHGLATPPPLGKAPTIGAFYNITLDLQGGRQKAVLHRPDLLDENQSLQLLMLVQHRVDLRQQARQAVLDITTRLLARHFGEHTQRHGLRQAITDHANLLDSRMYGQTIFDRRGRDVLTLAGFEDLLDAPCQAQVALGILLTLVTRAQKAIGGESLRGFLGILVVALHGRATTHQHFALLADAYLHIRIVLANPARLVTPGTTDMRITTVFRHAVDLLQVQSQAAIPVEQRLRHRC